MSGPVATMTVRKAHQGKGNSKVKSRGRGKGKGRSAVPSQKLQTLHSCGRRNTQLISRLGLRHAEAVNKEKDGELCRWSCRRHAISCALCLQPSKKQQCQPCCCSASLKAAATRQRRGHAAQQAADITPGMYSAVDGGLTRA